MYFLSNISHRTKSAVILDNVSFEIKKGEIAALIGPNGAGKSPLIKIILGIIKSKEGSINFSKDKKKINIGYLPQLDVYSYNEVIISAEEVIKTGFIQNENLFSLKNLGNKKDLKNLYKLIEVEHLLKKEFKDLSGGEKQRILLARAVLCNPEILILDEPSSALDIKYKEDFFRLIKKINFENKMTMLIVSHDIESIANFADTIIYLNKSVKFFGKVKDFCRDKNNYDGCFVRCRDHIVWHTHKKND